MSNFKIQFSHNLLLELKHLESEMVELSLFELQPRGGRTLLGIKQIEITQLETFLNPSSELKTYQMI